VARGFIPNVRSKTRQHEGRQDEEEDILTKPLAELHSKKARRVFNMWVCGLWRWRDGWLTTKSPTPAMCTLAPGLMLVPRE
jgi:hypothetical protein